MESYDRALAINSGWVEAILHRGRTLVELRRFEEALESYARALVINPAISEAHSDRGGVLIAMKRYEDAVASLHRALALDPDNAAALANLRREAETRGIAAQRIVFARRTLLLADHLARYRLADLFLDTLPYNAHVTTITGSGAISSRPTRSCMTAASRPCLWRALR